MNDNEETKQQSEVEAFDAVVVKRTLDPSGNVSTEVVTTGDVRLTEVAAILELGRTGWKERTGL